MGAQEYKYTGPERNLYAILRYLELNGFAPVYCGYVEEEDSSFRFWAPIPQDPELLPKYIERV